MGKHTNIPFKDMAKRHVSGPCRNQSCTCNSWQNSKPAGRDYPSTIDLLGFEHEDLQLEIWIIWGTSSLSLWKIHKSLQSTHTHIYIYSRKKLRLIDSQSQTKKQHENTICCLILLIDVYVHQHRTSDFRNLHDDMAPRRLGVRWNTSPSRFKAWTHGVGCPCQCWVPWAPLTINLQYILQVCLPLPKCQVNICKYGIHMAYIDSGCDNDMGNCTIQIKMIKEIHRFVLACPRPRISCQYSNPKCHALMLRTHENKGKVTQNSQTSKLMLP